MCVTTRADRDLSKGIAITSLLQTDEHSHSSRAVWKGSGFFGSCLASRGRAERSLRLIARWPQSLPSVNFLRASFVDDWRSGP